MEMKQYLKSSPHLLRLWETSHYFIQLDEAFKKILPANLREYCRVACINDGVLVVCVKNNMVASRLKMMLPAFLPQIQEFNDEIVKIEIKMLPENTIVKREKPHHLNENVLAMFERTAQQLSNQPALAQAIMNLVQRHR